MIFPRFGLLAQISLFAAAAPFLSAQLIPDRYLVEFAGESVAVRVARESRSPAARMDLRSREASAHHDAVVREQSAALAAIQEQEDVEVLDCVDTVSNTCFLRMSAEQAARVAQMPGVKRVRQERLYKRTLDHATAIHRAPQVWSQVGFENAGRGVKIGMIDTGIDNQHPGFQDPDLPVAFGFPQPGTEADRQFTNNKVIVARSYVRLLPNRDPDVSARDRVGHGTSTAMTAAGNTNTGPLATITGMAPKAWVGNYKVFGSPGVNDSASESALLRAINDAVNDNMDVLNLSLGAPAGGPIEDDALADALFTASAYRNVVVAVSAGNEGPNLNTIGDTGAFPSVITVGAAPNDRAFVGSATIDGIGTFPAAPAYGPRPRDPVSAPLVDIATIDKTDLACKPLPARSLAGMIALIPRNPDQCLTATKLMNARNAGALAGLLFNTSDQPDLFSPFLGTSLPAEVMRYSDGIKIQQALAGGTPNATLDFTLRGFTIDSKAITDFTSKGPGPGGSLKPDLLAVGAFVYTAAQKFDDKGDVYSPDGYVEVDGTSYSSPMVAGAAALLKAARPGLTAAQYKSLLVNNAAPFSTTATGAASVQEGGAGLLDVAAAYRGTIVANPVSISFGVQGQTANLLQSLWLTNLGTTEDTITLTVAPSISGTAGPTLSARTVQVAAGAAQAVTVDFNRAPTNPGSYQGVIRLQSAATGMESRVPYFYAVPSKPKRIQVLFSDVAFPVDFFDPFAAFFRIVDENGVALKNTVKPTATAVSGGGIALSVNLRDQLVADAWALNVKMGPERGPNVFRIQVGDVTKDITIMGVPAQ